MATSQSFVAAVRALTQRAPGAKGLRSLTRPTVREWLGACLLDAAGWTPEDLLAGTSVYLTHDNDAEQCVTDMVKLLFRRVLRQSVSSVEGHHDGGLTLLETGCRAHDYDDALNVGAPIVAVAATESQIRPRHVTSLAERLSTLDLPLLADVVSHLVAAVTGTAVNVPDDLAVRLTVGDVLRCVQHGSTAADCVARMRKVARELDTGNGADAPAPAPVTVGAGGVVRRLSEMTGFGEAGTWGVNLAADLAAYRAGTLPWSDVDRGMLLSGPPGGGKTTFARALALECDLELVTTNYGAWASGTGGDMVQRGLSKLFDEWRKKAATGPFILFWDEVDSVGRRNNTSHGDYWFGPIINSWLAFLDGAIPRDGIIVVGATNHPDNVDPALRRPGRMDRHLELPMPDVEALAGIVRAHLGPDAVLTDEEMTEAARAVRGRSPAEVQQLAREARRVARWCKRRVCASDLTDAVALLRGPVDEADDRMVAVHESGHAVAALVLGVDTLLWVDQDKGVTRLTLGPHWDEAVVLGRLRMQLAARAAEEVLLGRTSTGAGQDLDDATNLAIAYHAAWGWGATGLVSPGREQAMADPVVMAAVRTTLDEAYADAVALVRENRAAVERVAAALQRRRYLDAAEVRALVAGPVAPTPRVRRSAPTTGDRITRGVGRGAPGHCA